jgi:hypothetical protein
MVTECTGVFWLVKLMEDAVGEVLVAKGGRPVMKGGRGHFAARRKEEIHGTGFT